MNIAVVGSGICGMFAAMALATRGHRVTLFDRDDAPPEGGADTAFFSWQRNGAAQFRHPHAFLGLMCSLIEEHYPQLLESFYAAGARRVDFGEMLSPALQAQYTPQPGDKNLWVLLCRRATMETVIRRYVMSLPGIVIRNNARVTALHTTERDGRLVATGLSCEHEDRVEEFDADLIVDASGRMSRVPGWLNDLGCTVREEKHDAEIVYYTRHYRLLPGEEEPPRGDRSGAGDLGYLKYGVFPGDNGHFAIILCVPVQELALRKAVNDDDQFHQICLNIPGLEPWLVDNRSEPTTGSFGIGDIQAVWRHFLDDKQVPLVENLFVVGDASLRTNPLYGRGCSTSVLHAQLLAEVVDTIADPTLRAIEFDRRTEQQLRPIYDASLREDRNGIRRSAATLNGERVNKADSLKKWFALAFGDALSAAARERIDVLRAMMKTFHLLEKPGQFLQDPQIKRTVFRYMLRGRRRNAASRLQPGPDRLAMHELLNIQPS